MAMNQDPTPAERPAPHVRTSVATGLTLAALALTAWGLAGVLGHHGGYTDALFEPDYTIRHVPPDGPLDRAGFQPGDSVITVEGIPVVTLGMYSRWPRSLDRDPGESLTLVVERDGERLEGAVVFREPPPGATRRRLGALLVGLSFLGVGLWAFLAFPSVHSATLLAMGLALAVALPGPNLGTWNGVRDHLQLAGTVLWALLLLRFFLYFPERKRITRRRGFSILLLAPWVVLLGCLAVELLYHPRFYHSFGWLAGLLSTGYLALAAVAVVHTMVRTPRARLRASGMGIILLGLAVAVVPNAVAVAGWVIPPGFSTPGQDYFPLLAAVIPLALALGIRRHQTGERATAPPAPGPG